MVLRLIVQSNYQMQNKKILEVYITNFNYNDYIIKNFLFLH